MYYEIYSTWRARLIRDLANFLVDQYSHSNVSFIVVCTGSGANTNYTVATSDPVDQHQEVLKEAAETFVRENGYDI